MALVIGPANKERTSRAISYLDEDAQAEIQKLINCAYKNKHQSKGAREHTEADIDKELDGSIKKLRTMLKNTENAYKNPLKWQDVVSTVAILGLTAATFFVLAEKPKAAKDGLNYLRDQVKLFSPNMSQQSGR